MSIFASVTTVLFALGILFAAILYARLALAWRVAHDNGRLRLAQVLSRHGAPDQALDGAAFGAAVAMRRCMMCAQKSACDSWLASAHRSSVDGFCPNAEFIGRLASQS